MRVKLLFMTLTALMLIFGLVSCDGGGIPFEAGLNDSEAVGLELSDNDPIDDSFTSSVTKEHSNVQTWPHLATGQKKCYGLEGEIPCPEEGEAFYGQDGSYQYGVRAYVTNGDGTVSDSVTGLTWQMGYKEDVTWYGAENYCNTLTLNGDVWRLPDTHELKSLIDYGTNDPAIDTSAFPDTPPEWFWGGKAVGFDDIGAGLESSWIINFYDGFVEYTSRDNLYNARCVKAN